MAPHRPPRPQALLDAIEAEAPTKFSGSVWRVVTDGFDPLRPSRAGGRWDDGSFDMLYAASSRDGALAESWFHAAKGQPIIPSKITKRLFQIKADLHRVLDVSGRQACRARHQYGGVRAIKLCPADRGISHPATDRRGGVLLRLSNGGRTLCAVGGNQSRHHDGTPCGDAAGDPWRRSGGPCRLGRPAEKVIDPD
ncbi:MAG: hypothetical protein CGW95_07470 [Phenylobacterium zucineum]|nr:MAG: hypothetical protein CGW95_07470 [Phenylobacterium zucineum]